MLVRREESRRRDTLVTQGGSEPVQDGRASDDDVVRLAVWPSRYVMREVYIGKTISNFFFLMQAQLYTKLSW